MKKNNLLSMYWEFVPKPNGRRLGKKILKPRGMGS